MLSQEEKESIENQIFKAVENGRKVWADFEVTKEKKDFMSKIKIDNYIKENHPNYGKHLSIDTIEKIIETQGSPVQQFDLNNNMISEYKSQKRASILTGIDCGSINRVCNGRSKTAGGFIWKLKTKDNI